MASSETVLVLEEIRKSYNVGTPVEVEVLHGIDILLERGEFVALIGPSGSGKSTLLNIIGLLDRPTSGRVVIEGQDTALLDDAGITRLRGHSIGFVFQYHYLISAFTALENVMMPMLADRSFPDDAMRARAHQLLVQVGLAQWENNLATNMSGGQQQRVAIARALANAPAIVLGDEPTGNLDTRSGQEIMDLLLELNRAGTTLIVVTHDARLCTYAHRVVRMEDGVVLGVDAGGRADEPRRSVPIEGETGDVGVTAAAVRGHSIRRRRSFTTAEA